MAEIYLNCGKSYISESMHCIGKAIEANTRNKMKLHLGKDYLLYSKVLKRQDNPQKAIEALHMAKRIFNKCGADGWVEKAEKEIERYL